MTFAVSNDDLRKLREARGWDEPRLARELHAAAKNAGEQVAAHHGLVKMIRAWESGRHKPTRRYLYLYRIVFLKDGNGTMPDPGPLAALVRQHAADLPAPGMVTAMERAALALPGQQVPPDRIRALCDGIRARLREIDDALAELTQALGGER